jgi:ketosteroid isomerase-like protein
MTDVGVIRDLEKQRFHALRDSDVDTLDELCVDELVYLHANATRDSKAALLAKLRNQELRCTDALHHPDDDIVLIGDTAIATGRVTGTVYVHGVAVELCNSAVAVWTRSGGRWRLIAYQATPIPTRSREMS